MAQVVCDRGSGGFVICLCGRRFSDGGFGVVFVVLVLIVVVLNGGGFVFVFVFMVIVSWS